MPDLAEQLAAEADEQGRIAVRKRAQRAAAQVEIERHATVLQMAVARAERLRIVAGICMLVVGAVAVAIYPAEAKHLKKYLCVVGLMIGCVLWCTWEGFEEALVESERQRHRELCLKADALAREERDAMRAAERRDVTLTNAALLGVRRLFWG
jgi:hypothetical protein